MSERMEAAELISEIDRVRRRSRARASMMWFPMLVFGTLTVVSAAVVLRYGGAALGAYWMVAAPVGGVATGLVAHRRHRQVGIDLPAGRYVAVAALILVGASLTGGLGGVLGAHRFAAVGPPLVVAIGYLLFARLERSRLLAWTAAGLVALTLALLATGMSPDPLAATLAVGYGAAFLATGLVLLGRQP